LIGEYAFIGIFLLIALIFGVAPLAIAWVVSPKRSHPRKQETYESGVPTYGSTWIRFKPQYYLYALAFLVFDVEAALLLPWAVAYQFLPMYAVIEALIFLAILVVGLVYVWLKGDLEWM